MLCLQEAFEDKEDRRRHKRKEERVHTHDAVNSLQNINVDVLSVLLVDSCGVISVCAVSEAIFVRSHGTEANVVAAVWHNSDKKRQPSWEEKEEAAGKHRIEVAS